MQYENQQPCLSPVQCLSRLRARLVCCPKFRGISCQAFHKFAAATILSAKLSFSRHQKWYSFFCNSIGNLCVLHLLLGCLGRTLHGSIATNLLRAAVLRGVHRNERIRRMKRVGCAEVELARRIPFPPAFLSPDPFQPKPWLFARFCAYKHTANQVFASTAAALCIGAVQADSPGTQAHRSTVTHRPGAPLPQRATAPAPLRLSDACPRPHRPPSPMQCRPARISDLADR